MWVWASFSSSLPLTLGICTSRDAASTISFVRRLRWSSTAARASSGCMTISWAGAAEGYRTCQLEEGSVRPVKSSMVW